jgi:DNA (cytosine-5)-methyltransferase 1
MAQTYRSINIGTHRGKPRLWLEGTWLVEAGFTRGATYVASFGAGRIALRVLANGEDTKLRRRTVSGKTKNSRDVAVIDINSTDIPFTGAAKVVVYAQRAHILITPEAA